MLFLCWLQQHEYLEFFDFTFDLTPAKTDALEF